MSRFDRGDRVRLDVLDETDPDHDEQHGEHGVVVALLQDDAGQLTGDDRDSTIYRVELESGERRDFRPFDLRSPLDADE